MRARCPDCHAPADLEDAGTVCAHCGRGIIEAHPHRRRQPLAGSDLGSCPSCGSSKLSEGEWRLDGHAFVFHRLECLDCGVKWNDTYALIARAVPNGGTVLFY